MARLASLGAELNTLTANVEVTSSLNGASVSTATVRSGTYAYRFSGFTSGANNRISYQFSAANVSTIWARSYFYFVTLPSAKNRIFRLQDTTGGSRAYLSIDNAGLLTVGDEDGDITTGSTLSTGQWYELELRIDRSGSAGSHIVQARVDEGTAFGSSTRSVGTGVSALSVGSNLANEAQTQGEWFCDDIAANDDTGSFQNSWPGAGKIIHLRPSAAGDANGFLVQVGGTAGAANNFSRVNEVTPNDATSYNGSAALSAEDLFNVDDSGIGGSDVVNVVAVGVRMADLVGADATAAFKLEIEKTSGGTKTQSGTLIPNSTTWISNAAASPRNYSLTTYQDPDAAAWSQTTLDSMQIGYIQTATNVQTIAVSAVWALVEHTPAATTTSTSSSTSSSTSTSISTSSTSTSRSTSTSASTSVSTSTSFSTSSTSSSTSQSTSSSTSVSTSTSLSTSSTSTSVSTSTSTSTSFSSTSFSTSSTSTSTTTLPPAPLTVGYFGQPQFGQPRYGEGIIGTSTSTSSSTSSTSTSSTSSSTSFSSTSSSTSTSTTMIDYRTIPHLTINWRYNL